jgi:Mn2+/Fe2+ NRAMP family transporter
VSESSDSKRLPAWLAPVAAIVGPAAVMTAGIMGAGSTGSLVLAGAWFRYDLLWIAILTLPAVVVCLDSGARVGVVSGHKGMLSLISEQINPAYTWFVLLVMVLFNVFVNMAQMDVMTESFLSILGYYSPGEDAAAEVKSRYMYAEIALSLLFSGGLVALLLSGGYKRAQIFMTGLLFFMFLCFFVVALRGFQELPAILAGLIPSIPQDLQVPDSEKVRDSYLSIRSIAGGALAAAPILSFSYFTSDDKATPEDLPKYFKKAVISLGVIFGLYSVLVLVSGGFALYPLDNSAQIEKVEEAGRVLKQALPGALGGLGPKIFAAGLFCCGLTTLVVVAQLMCYFCLDGIGRDWKYTKENTAFRWLLVFWIVFPAVLAPLWEFPVLPKMILLMGINIVIVPVAIVIIMYLINKRSLMGDYKASPLRNLFLVASLVLSLWLASSKLPGYWSAIFG